MSDSNTNPFILPGLGQDGDLSGNPLLASMEMMRKAWAGLAGPGGLAQALPMAAPMNVEDLERRIAELRAVENWLRMNLSMLSSTIQGMEVQRATIATLRSFVGGVAASGDASPLEVVLGLKPGTAAPRASSQSAPPPSPAADRDASGGQAGPDASAADQVSQAAQSASQAWWNLLQQQFNQLASATAATMPDATAQGTPAQATPAGQGSPAPRKRTPRKAAKRAPAPRKS
ncbi:MAG TPA: PhaM family polyhydroxyalkanoate granule multifunctional regulatory protein [Bordetella sp.]|nr:PhaM family polyhydroxyalkanoate granule multifunctional regulatory protein [Bordetella sp.]